MARRKLERNFGTNKKVIEAYNDFQTNNKVKNLSEQTITSYYWNLKHIMTFLQEQGIERISEVSEDTFTDFILWLKERHDNAITINTYLRNTRAFFYFCMKKGYMPQFVVTLLKQEEKVMTTYTDQDILKLVRKPNLKTCLFSEHRDWVAIQFFIETGCRIRTLVNIKVADLDVENRRVIFRVTKNRTEQDMPLSRRLVQVLPDYIDLWNLQPEGYLFPNAQGEKTSEDSVKASIADYNIRRGVEVTSVHAFRHTFAKNFIVTGGNSFKLQTLLGHKDLSTTKHYVKLFSDDLHDDIDEHSVLDRVNPNKQKLKKTR